MSRTESLVMALLGREDRYGLESSETETIEILKGRKIQIELDPAARAWLAEKGFDRAFGARPMARLVEKSIKKPLSELLLFGDVKDGARVVVDIRDNAVVLRLD